MMSKPLSILLLEDSQLDAELVAEHLDRAGIAHQIRRVETRADYLNAIENDHPEMILSDFALPSFDGPSALELASAKCPEVPFLFVSGAMGEEVAIESLKRGATDYVLKGKLERLAPSVRRAMRETRERAERERMGAELRRNEERLRIALNAARLGAWELDPVTEELECSETCRSNFGVLVNTRMTLSTLLDRIHPEDREMVARRTRRAIQDREAYDVEFRVRWEDESWHWILSSGRVVPDHTGTDRLAGVTMDITQRKQAEVDLATLNRDLEQFIWAASHDLREPLRTVRTFAQLLDRECKDRLGTRCREHLEYVESGAQRMEKLLHDLLDYTRLRDNEHATMPVDLNEVLGDVLVMFQLAIQESGTEVVAHRLPVVLGESTQLTLVLQNLISNAIKYRNSKPPRIEISAVPDSDGFWTITVADNGMGFDQKYAEYIFGLFKRLETDRHSGSGLGLAICKRIVERAGGRMWATSMPGAGAQFRFTVPGVRESEGEAYRAGTGG